MLCDGIILLLLVSTCSQENSWPVKSFPSSAEAHMEHCYSFLNSNSGVILSGSGIAKSRKTAKSPIQTRSLCSGPALFSPRTCILVYIVVNMHSKWGVFTHFVVSWIVFFLLPGGLLQPFKYFASGLSWFLTQSLWNPEFLTSAHMMKLITYFLYCCTYTKPVHIILIEGSNLWYCARKSH